MALTPGARLGPYEILSALGAGGMGEVYRARDTRLDRDVAIKILPEAFTADAERVARFQREAKVLASLNHQNIATIHGLEQADGAHALVMELVEGEDLAQRIERGAIPIDEALPIAKQITEALEAAHEQGIIHRDLKPANIKVRPDGTVKVLDFGLAKAMDPPISSPGVSQSPTITTPAMSQAGMILGTAAYMSPEQAKGRLADKRSDVWAFGCVLYEMLTGKRVFEGEDVSDTLANVLKSEPEWHALPADLPEHIRLLLRRCLEKDRSRRISDVSIARFLITEPVTTAVSAATASGGVAAPARPLWRRALPAVVSVVVVCALTAGAMWRLRHSVPAPVTRFAMALPDGQQLTGARGLIAISPVGTHIVYTANERLYVRSLADLEVRPVTGGADDPGGLANRTANPVFSPDGRSIAYFDLGDSTIKRIPLSGGAAVTVCEVTSSPYGWNWDGNTIFFGQPNGIMRVSANGGKPEMVASVKTGEFAHGPQLLPDGQTLLFTLATGANADRWDKARIVAESMKSHERKILIEGGSDARYLPTGHLVYALGGVVFALPFDVKRMMPSGSPVPIVEGVMRSRAGGAQYGISDTGSLAYIPGPVTTSGQVSIGLFDRKGGSAPLKVQPGVYQLPRLSPDGTRIAFGSDDGKQASIWIYELSGASSMRRVTFDGQGHNRFPVWSADSQRVAFQSDREGDLGIFWQRADGAGTPERLTKAEEGTSHIPESWAPDGDHFLYNNGKGGATSLWVFSLKDKKAVRFGAVESPAATLTGAVFSPDGRWVAYASREGRRSSAVYVQPFPPTGAKYQISKNDDDGHHPMWSSDGAELVFSPGPVNLLAAVRVTTHPSFTVGEPIPVATSFQKLSPAFERPFDISRDGQRFIGLIDTAQTQAAAPATEQIRVVLNWFEEVKARVPTK